MSFHQLNENFIELQYVKLFYKITNGNSISHIPAFMLTFNKKSLVVKNLSGNPTEKMWSLGFSDHI